jgi:hypothetical protein
MAKTAIRPISPLRIDFFVVTACIWNPLHLERISAANSAGDRRQT